jgi:hypothetical protein
MMARSIIDVDFKTSERYIRDFMGVGNFVLSIIVIPDVHPSISSGEEKYTWSGRRETAVRQISSVIFSSDNWHFQIILPYFSTPVSH